MIAAHSPPTSGEVLPRELLDPVVELAICVHKRAIYPESHPMLHGSVDQLLDHLTRLLGARHSLSIGVANKRLVVEGISTSDDHIHLRELAATLHEHLLGAIRFTEGIARDELTGLLGVISRSTARDAEPFGQESRSALSQWPHIELYPVAFDRLELLGDGEPGDGDSRAGHLWIALARAALAGGWSEEKAGDARFVAQTFEQRRDDQAYDQVVVGCLVQLLEELRIAGPASPAAVRHRASDLIENLSDEGLARLMSLGEAPAQRRELVRNALDSLSARAVVDLARSASQSGATGAASGSLLRLLNKLGRSTVAPAFAKEADAMLRLSVRRLMEDWTLDNPNPVQYDEWLSASAAGPSPEFRDEHRDRAEPWRIVDIGLECGARCPAVEEAFGRLIMAQGVNDAIEFLWTVEASDVRDHLMDRILHDASLREQLALERPDWSFVRHAVRWMRARSVRPLITALGRRPDGDADAIRTLLVQVGWDGLPEIGQIFSTLTPPVQRQLILLFDTLEAWPPDVDPLALARHPDAGVRREAIRSLLRNEGHRELILPTAARDPDLRVFNLALQAALRHCSVETARALISRYGDAALGSELRVRIIRAAAQTRAPEVLPWLLEQAAATRWLFRSRKLRSSPEAVAALTGVATHFADSPQGAQLLAMGRASRSAEMRRAAAARPSEGQE